MNSVNINFKDENSIKLLLADFYKSRKRKPSSTDYLEAAMFIEDSFHIILKDDEISNTLIDDPEASLKLIMEKVQKL